MQGGTSFEPSVPGGLPVDRWFLSKFCRPHQPAFDVFAQEFYWIDQTTSGGVPGPMGEVRNNHNRNFRPNNYGRANFNQSPANYCPPFIRPKRNARTIQSKAFGVNAHYVEGMKGRTYIASEGPNPSSVYDFWEMVWQEEVQGVLMLNQPYEERLKPEAYNAAHETIQYWPLVVGEVKSFAPWKIQCLWTSLKILPTDQDSAKEEENTYVYRVSRISVVESNPILQRKPRELVHVCYYRWPDGQIPNPLKNGDDTLGLSDSNANSSEVDNYANSALGLADMIRCELGNVSGPIVVHCHAGVGRTGVAIALDIAFCRLTERTFADVRETVRRIREQRPKAVMNIWQYAYINLTLAELALREGLLPKSITFPHQKHSNNYHVQHRKREGEVSSRSLVRKCWEDMLADLKQALCLDETQEEYPE